MSKSKKLLKKQETQIFPRHCPICGVETNFINRIVDNKNDAKNEADWYSCQCGVIFQKELPSHEVYDRDYIRNYIDYPGAEERLTYHGRIYAPIVEELIMGRMMLEVGFCNPYNLDFFKDRGWLTWGIEMNEDITPGGNIYKGDFETYDFSVKLPDNAKELGLDKAPERLFDVIWMSHVFEHFADPIAALRKCYDLMPDNGVLFLTTPDIEFIFKTGVSGWPHWAKDEHYIMWSERALKRELERLGFKIILCRRNYSSRFASWHDIHIIAQKNYF